MGESLKISDKASAPFLLVMLLVAVLGFLSLQYLLSLKAVPAPLPNYAPQIKSVTLPTAVPPPSLPVPPVVNEGAIIPNEGPNLP